MSYGLKLVSLSLAAFYVVHLAAALAASCFAPAAIRAAERMRARAAARLMLTLRFAPLAIAFAVVALLCVPSYLSFEPEANAEHAGFLCLAAALLFAAIWSVSIARALRAILRSRQVGSAAIAMAGVIRPRLIVSGEVKRLLSPEEMDVALRHERAHAGSRDNLKRLLMLLAPDALPLVRGGFARIEFAWRKFAEWAADDEAVGGNAQSSVALASALVRVARMGIGPAGPLITSLTDGDLNARVERLLRGAAPGDPDRWTPRVCLLSAIALGAVVAQPAALAGVYELLERFLR